MLAWQQNGLNCAATLMTTPEARLPGRGAEGGAPYSAAAVANFFLAKGGELTQMKLHKLLYYAHGWYLGVVGRPLLNETISAWKHGPVAPSLYYDLKRFGARPIDRLARRMNRVTRVRSAPSIPQDDHLVRALLERIWSVYGGLSGPQLSQMTHAAHSPWSQARQRHPDLMVVDIPNEAIREHFRRRLLRGARHE